LGGQILSECPLPNLLELPGVGSRVIDNRLKFFHHARSTSAAIQMIEQFERSENDSESKTEALGDESQIGRNSIGQPTLPHTDILAKTYKSHAKIVSKPYAGYSNALVCAP
jgi:hypothetical protein